MHGSAPKYAGKDIANPIGTILSAAMLLEHIGHDEAAARVEQAVAMLLRSGRGPREVGGDLGTQATGDAVIEALRSAA